ncbi:MAG: transcription termination/antitermination protein NusA [Candidatus Omnitrophica bacterium]|nr:transcription termination/antitermination protein NusA [Candidatus Omnitrophota bacterium]
MNGELLNILENIEREKGINREVLLQAVESALLSATRKTYGQTENIEVVIDRSSGAIKIVQDGKEIKKGEFGRIAAQTAKQVIIQKIREAERESIFGEYQKRTGELVSGTVHRFEKRSLIVDLGRTEAIVPPQEQSPRERYSQGDRIRACVLEVSMTNRGPQIVLSRTNPMLVKKLFEMEVPEITEGIVHIKAVSRDAGDRAKIAVISTDEKVDAVGACVGMRGQRVKNVVRELRGERIDIVRFSDDLRTFVTNSLSPAEVSDIRIDREGKRVTVQVKDDQLAGVIGKKGQNVRLASRLVGWEIDVYGSKPKLDIPLTDLEGVGPKTAAALEAAGFKSVVDIADSSAEALSKVKGISGKGAEKMLKAAQKAVQEAGEKARTALFEAAMEKASKERAREEKKDQGEKAETAPETSPPTAEPQGEGS